MGYIKLIKADSTVDLLPAENIIHVSVPSTTNKDIGIRYGIPSGESTLSFVTAIIAGADASGSDAELTADSRKGIIEAIEKANGASGPAIPVYLGDGLFCKSVTTGDTDPS
jgi:hypothetical protein|tara:strand:+ start:275 stop:607 length:333 start_codon:yes stop_codon:yes gene_type:complete